MGRNYTCHGATVKRDKHIKQGIGHNFENKKTMKKSLRVPKMKGQSVRKE